MLLFQRENTSNEPWRRIGRVFADASGTIVPFIVTGANNDRKCPITGAYTERVLKERSAVTWTSVPGGKWIIGGDEGGRRQVSCTRDQALIRTDGSATPDVLVVGSVVVGISIGSSADILEFQHSSSGTTQVFVTGLEETI